MLKSDLQCVIKSEKITLHPLEEHHRTILYNAAKDPQIWTQHPNHDRWKREVFDEFFDFGLEGGLAFAVEDRSTGDIIGSSRYKLHDSVKSAVEIGWTFLSRNYWGGHWNGELKRLMISHAHLFFSDVLLCIGDRNLRSAKAAEKIGALLISDSSDELYDHRPNYLTYRITRKA